MWVLNKAEPPISSSAEIHFFKTQQIYNDALVEFFKEVLARREELDIGLKNPVGGVCTNVGANSNVSDRISQSSGFRPNILTQH